MVILRTQNKITDFLMILAWASPFKIFQIKQILEFCAMIFFYLLLERFLDLQMTC